VLGCGYWGSKHLRVLSSTPGVDRVVAFDRDGDVLGAVAERWPSVEPASSLTELLEVVDGVVVATPPGTHGTVACAAIEAGCHVLVEKPIATSVAEAEAIVDGAECRGLVLMSGHTFEYNPAVWKLRDLIRGGDLGRVLHASTARLNLGLYRGDVNVLWDLAPHDISILNYVTSSRPDSVSAWAASHAHDTVEDVAYLRLHYGRIGLVAHVHVSWLDPRKVRQVTVVGSRKMAIYDDLAGDERIKVFDKGVVLEPAARQAIPPTASYRQGGMECPHIDFEEPLAVEARAFVDSIRWGSEVVSDGRSGLAVVRVLAAAERSLRLGRPVEVDDGDTCRAAEGPAVAGSAAGTGAHRYNGRLSGRAPGP
jgi:predicted dehydrogenase